MHPSDFRLINCLTDITTNPVRLEWSRDVLTNTKIRRELNVQCVSRFVQHVEPI